MRCERDSFEGFNEGASLLQAGIRKISALNPPFSTERFLPAVVYMGAGGALINRQGIRPKRMNDLSPSQWLIFTKTWFIINPPSRLQKVTHPATFPADLVASFIEFFTKPGDWILDPFLGSGTTLLVARRLNRNGVGIELYPEFSKFAKKSVSQIKSKSQSIILGGDSRDILTKLKNKNIPDIDLCITSPPYWCQLGTIGERNGERKKKGLKTKYGNNKKDLGNIQDYDLFLHEQEHIFNMVHDVAKPKSYLVVVTNNIYRNGRLYPLAFDTFKSLSKLWVPKDERIWCQDNKHLYPFGMFHSYIGNRSHHYCLIFRKNN